MCTATALDALQAGAVSIACLGHAVVKRPRGPDWDPDHDRADTGLDQPTLAYVAQTVDVPLGTVGDSSGLIASLPVGPSANAAATGSSRRNIRRLGNSSAVAAVVGILSQLFLTPFVIRVADLETYGTFVVLSTYLAFGTFLDFGLRAELTRRVAASRAGDDWSEISANVNQATALLGVVGLFVLALGASLAPVVASFTVPSHGATELLIALIALTAVGFVFDGRVAALNGLQRGDVLQYAGIASALVRIAATVTLLLIYQSVWSLFLAQVASSLTVWVIVTHRLARLAPSLELRPVRPRWNAARIFWGGSVLLALSQVSDIVDYNVDRVLIAHFRGVREAAQFTVGAQLPISLRSLALIPTGVLLAGVAEFSASSDRRKADVLLDGVTRLVLGVGVVTLIGTLALAPVFYDVYLGHGFHLTATAAQLLSIATFLNLCSAGWGLYAVAHGWYRVVGWAAASNVIVNGTASFALIVSIGYVGAPLGSILGNVTGLVALYIGVRSRERRAWLRPVLPPCLVAGVLAVPAYLCATHHLAGPWLTLTVGIPVAIVVCAAGLLLTRSVTPRLVRSLVSRNRPV